MQQAEQTYTRQAPAWVHRFDGLRDIVDPAWIENASRARVVDLPAGYQVFREGDACRYYLLIIEGTIRVCKEFESGREILLYRLHQGETCSLTTSVLLSGGVYPANAATEKETRAVLIPARDFHALFDASRGFRNFVCAVFGSHIRELVVLLEAVSMRHVDVRLARWLLDNCNAGNGVDVSHREVACELGTAREVISRHLKEFESRGWVSLQRKYIELLRTDDMQLFANGIR